MTAVLASDAARLPEVARIQETLHRGPLLASLPGRHTGHRARRTPP